MITGSTETDMISPYVEQPAGVSVARLAALDENRTPRE
jgi:hypothetical protein